MTKSDTKSMLPGEWFCHKNLNTMRHLPGGETEIMLTQCYTAVVKTCDVCKIESHTWHVAVVHKKYVNARTRVNGKVHTMGEFVEHRFRKIEPFSLHVDTLIEGDTGVYKYGRCMVRWAKVGTDHMIEVMLTLGKFALIDFESLDTIKDYKWFVHEHGRTFYAETCVGKKTVKMHRLILPSSDTIDHKDRNGLNNTTSNLRSACQRENNNNRRLTKRNKTGENGISWRPVGNGSYTFEWREDDKRHTRTFGVRKYGSIDAAFSEAKRYATIVRERIGNYNGGESLAERESKKRRIANNSNVNP